MPHERPSRTICATAFAFAASAVIGPLAANAQALGPKTAEQEYKNITALKGVPADQLMPAMNFISTSLGVSCEFCHTMGKFEADDKGAKKTAREMMAMQAMINKESFGGRTQVTCYSCHRGSARPVNMPPIEGTATTPATMTPPAPPAATASAPTETVDSILAKYIAAVGGAEAIGKVSTRVMKGVMAAGGVTTNIEVYTKAPNKRVTIVHNSPIGTEGAPDTVKRTNDQYTAYDGKAGWMGSSGRPVRDMTPQESEASSLDAEFSLALRLKEIFPQLRRGRPEQVRGMQCEVLNGSGPGKPAVRLYFDSKSGLLVRMVRYADTPVGRMPTQIDYDDYRAIGSVKVPYRWTLARTMGSFMIQINEAAENVRVDDAKFVKPAGNAM